VKHQLRWNLKLVLGGLAVSAVVLPMCVALLISLAVSSKYDELPRLRLHSVEAELARAVKIDSSGHSSFTPDYQSPPGFSLVLADSEGLVKLSSASEFALGSKIDIASAAAAAGADHAAMSFFGETIESKGKILGSYFAWMPSTTPMIPTVVSTRASLFILGLIVVVFILGALVATQLAQAVFKLERAAGRIAAGDFSTVVSVKHNIREIADLAAAMDGMRRALREDKDRRARFLAAISHDLRTPLTSIGGYLEAVSDGLASDPETLERYVNIMRGKTRLLEGRIASLIEFARMETEEWRMGFATIELKPFLEHLCGMFREDAALMGREFFSDLAALAGLHVAVDRALLTRAFENLMSNAIRYSPAGSSVRMKAERATTSEGKAGCYIHIDDEGPGIALSEREKVFEPFVRGSASREGEGIGMGLYIVASVIKGHGWDVVAGESSGGGGRFSIFIPLSLPWSAPQ
jgi:signal transduction histidine kinase